MIVSIDGHHNVVQGESAWKSLAQLDVLDRSEPICGWEQDYQSELNSRIFPHRSHHGWV